MADRNDGKIDRDDHNQETPDSVPMQSTDVVFMWSGKQPLTTEVPLMDWGGAKSFDLILSLKSQLLSQ